MCRFPPDPPPLAEALKSANVDISGSKILCGSGRRGGGVAAGEGGPSEES